MAFNALYTALQTGLIDAATRPSHMIEMKFYQVTKYLTLTSHYSIVNVLIVSKKFMDVEPGGPGGSARPESPPSMRRWRDPQARSPPRLLQDKGIQVRHGAA